VLKSEAPAAREVLSPAGTKFRLVYMPSGLPLKYDIAPSVSLWGNLIWVAYSMVVALAGLRWKIGVLQVVETKWWTRERVVYKETGLKFDSLNPRLEEVAARIELGEFKWTSGRRPAAATASLPLSRPPKSPPLPNIRNAAIRALVLMCARSIRLRGRSVTDRAPPIPTSSRGAPHDHTQVPDRRVALRGRDVQVVPDPRAGRVSRVLVDREPGVSEVGAHLLAGDHLLPPGAVLVVDEVVATDHGVPNRGCPGSRGI
jgi:hypothetical protein